MVSRAATGHRHLAEGLPRSNYMEAAIVRIVVPAKKAAAAAAFLLGIQEGSGHANVAAADAERETG